MVTDLGCAMYDSSFGLLIWTETVEAGLQDLGKECALSLSISITPSQSSLSTFAPSRVKSKLKDQLQADSVVNFPNSSIFIGS